jgi:hypothetical protein
MAWRDHLTQDRQLGPGGVGAELRVNGPRVVDEHVEPVMAGPEFAGESADCGQVLQIGQPVADPRAAGFGSDAAPGPLGPVAAAGGKVDRRAPPGQGDCGPVADPGGGAGDDDGLSVDGGRLTGGELGQQPGPDGQPDPGEARDNAGLQGRVHRLPEARAAGWR